MTTKDDKYRGSFLIKASARANHRLGPLHQRELFAIEEAVDTVLDQLQKVGVRWRADGHLSQGEQTEGHDPVYSLGKP